MTKNSFDLKNTAAYLRWRDEKLIAAPRSLEKMCIDVKDPRALSNAERTALLKLCYAVNWVIYRGPNLGEDRSIPRLIGEQLGLRSIDYNLAADEDGLSDICVAGEKTGRTDFIPYTTRPLHWHTDGYYNPPNRQIRGMVLHCVRPAASGGGNALFDHEIAYLLLRDENPDYINALSDPAAMTIPAYSQKGQVVRAAVSGPVFSIDTNGHLHMRYTARTKNIIWSDEARVAVTALEHVLSTSEYVLRTRLGPGEGIVSNNNLHDREAFIDDPNAPRLLYRARYHDRISQS